MTKTKLVFIAMALALVAWVGASAASAQDQTLTADPDSVSEAGTYDFTLTPTGFTQATNLAICKTDDASVLTGMAALTQYCGGLGSAQDSSGPFTVEGVEVGEEGVTFLLFQLVPDGESASVSVVISAGDGDDAADDSADDSADDAASDDSGADDDMDDDMADDMDDDMGDDMADDMDDDMGDDMADDMDDDMGDDMADDMGDDMMPATGSNTPLLVIIALSVVLAGALVLGLSRRLRTQ